MRRLLVTASVVPSSPILVTLMKEALSSSETSVLTRATRRDIPEDAILHSHRRENLKSYTPTYFIMLSASRRTDSRSHVYRTERDGRKRRRSVDGRMMSSVVVHSDRSHSEVT
jgi:hypothetical protein